MSPSSSVVEVSDEEESEEETADRDRSGFVRVLAPFFVELLEPFDEARDATLDLLLPFLLLPAPPKRLLLKLLPIAAPGGEY